MKELVQGTTNSPTTSQNQGNLELAGRIAIRMPKRRGSNQRSEVRGRRSEDRISDFGFRISDFGLRIFQLKTVSQCVIPAKSRRAGREPGSRKNWTIYKSRWIPDLVRVADSSGMTISTVLTTSTASTIYRLPLTAYRLPFTIYDFDQLTNFGKIRLILDSWLCP